jgi:hypothetical protein
MNTGGILGFFVVRSGIFAFAFFVADFIFLESDSNNTVGFDELWRLGY